MQLKSQQIVTRIARLELASSESKFLRIAQIILYPKKGNFYSILLYIIYADY